MTCRLYKWTCFGLHSLMTNLFKSKSSKIQKGEESFPYVIKFMCATERTLAFTIGGNLHVLSHSVMHPLFILQEIVNQGMPTFKPIYGQLAMVSASDPLFFRKNQWPWTKDIKSCAIASKHGQILTCREAHYLVSIFILFLLSPGLWWRCSFLINLCIYGIQIIHIHYVNVDDLDTIDAYNDKCPPHWHIVYAGLWGWIPHLPHTFQLFPNAA
jgi:hypothetical protein